MNQVSVTNLSSSLQGPLQAGYCSSFLCRLRGLTFRCQLPLEQGLLLVQRRENRLDASIHMLMVWMDLGVVWINNAGAVVDTVLAKSWHTAYFPQAPARYVLEIHPERLAEFHIGDKVTFEDPLD
jgi:uncharacterized membrane protein (UPF0127 family)